MVAATFDPPLHPRDGRTLRVLVVTRISTIHQDELSLDDQNTLCERPVRESYAGPVEFTAIGGRGSGERLDRAEFLDLLEKIESGRYDLVITEDLGRICRRIQAMEVCETCLDHGVRLVALNDHVDTAKDDWDLNGFFAVMRHQLYNKDTAKRIRRTQRNRFLQGGVLTGLIYGYVKPAGAKSDDEIEKDPAATPVYDQWFDLLEAGATYAEVADWLNANGIPTGPYCRRKSWTGPMVAAVTGNTLLKGVRYRNGRKSVRINRTGRRKSIKAPLEERLERDCPHLAHIEPARYDRVLRLLRSRNGGRGRKPGPQKYARKRSRWPGDHMTCGVCGRPMHWGGHGQSTRMVCSGARDYACWNAVTCDGVEAAEKITAALIAAAESLPGWESSLAASIGAKASAAADDRAAERADLVRRISITEAKLDRLADELAERGGNATLRRKIDALDAERETFQVELDELDRRPAVAVALPEIEELKKRARAAAVSLAADDPAFGRLMKTLVPVIELYPVRPFDGGKAAPRLVLTFELAALGASPLPEAIAAVIRRTVTIDLFDPPQRIMFLEDVARLRGDGLTEREVARRLGITQTAVQRSVRLQRLMEAAGATEPFVVLTEPPEDDGKLRRHRHPRYRFNPLPHKRLVTVSSDATEEGNPTTLDTPAAA